MSYSLLKNALEGDASGFEDEFTSNIENSVMDKISELQEEVEGLQEISKEKTVQYIDKARKEMRKKEYDDVSDDNVWRKVKNRGKGIDTAYNKRDGNSRAKVKATQ